MIAIFFSLFLNIVNKSVQFVCFGVFEIPGIAVNTIAFNKILKY